MKLKFTYFEKYPEYDNVQVSLQIRGALYEEAPPIRRVVPLPGGCGCGVVGRYVVLGVWQGGVEGG